jgi:hypothetical protein
MSSVVKKISYSIVLRFPVFDVDVSKELTRAHTDTGAHSHKH